jgi:hypothetical protein
MGQLTPTRSLPFPDPTDIPDVPADVERLARATERELDDNRHAIETVAAEVVLVKSDLQGVKTDVANVKHTVGVISNAVDLMKNDVENLESDVASLDQRVDMLVGELVFCGTYNAETRKVETLSAVAYSEYKDPVPYGYGDVLDPLRPQNNKGFREIPAMAWNAKHFFIVNTPGPTMNPDGTLLDDGIDQPGSTSPEGLEATVDRYEVGDWIMSNGRGVLGRINPLTGASENVNIIPMMPREANSWLHMSYSARFALASSINVDVAALNTATSGKTPTLPAQENTVQKALAWFHTNKVSVTGDTMTGNLRVVRPIASAEQPGLDISPASGAAILRLDAKNQYVDLQLRSTAGVSKRLTFGVGAAGRWVMQSDESAESGNTAGSNFGIHRYNDAGIHLGTPLSIIRANGEVAVSGDAGLRIRNNAGQSALLKAHFSNGQYGLRVEDGGTVQLAPVSVAYPRTNDDAATKLYADNNIHHTLRYSIAHQMTNGNLNTLSVSGFYDGSSMIGAPDTGWWYIEHIAHSNNPTYWATQKAYGFYDVNAQKIRKLINGTWSNWVDAAGVGEHTHSGYANSTHSHSYAASDHSHSYAGVHDHPYAASSHAHGYYNTMRGGSVAVAGGSGANSSADLAYAAFSQAPVVTITPDTSVPYSQVRMWSMVQGQGDTDSITCIVNRTNTTNTWFHVQAMGSG